jgi:hypothetical protein
VSDRSNAIRVIASQKPTHAPAGPSLEDEIALSALLAGLSQAIPIPFVDDEAEAFMRKRMIRHIIAAHHLSLSESDIQILQTSSQHHRAKKAITAMAFISANRILQRIALKIVQKATIVLIAKLVSDAFSRTYHIGYLLDYAIRQQWTKQRSPQQIRAAIDIVCSEMDTSPVNRAFVKVFKKSWSLLGSIMDYLLKVFAGKPAAGNAVDESPEAVPPEVTGWVEKIQTALDLMPPAYYRKLCDRFAAELELNRQDYSQSNDPASMGANPSNEV